MNRRRLIFTGLLGTAAGPALVARVDAAEEEAAKEPDDIGAMFRRLPATGELTPLESRRARWAKRQQKFSPSETCYISKDWRRQFGFAGLTAWSSWSAA